MKCSIVYLLFITAAVMSSCGKNPAMDVNYRIATFNQDENNKPKVVYTDAVVFCYDIDTNVYALRNYADAVAGVLRDKNGSGTVAPAYTGVYTNDTLVLSNITTPKVTMVICDKRFPIYGIKVVILPEEPFTIRETFVFRPYKYGTSTEGQWSMHNELIPPPTEPDNPDKPDTEE